MTTAQARALATLRPQYVIDPPTDTIAADFWQAQFDRTAPLGIEIGFGMGDALIAWARTAPSWNLVGIDVYQPGIGALMNACVAEEVGNIRIIEGEALSVLQRMAPATLAECRVLFPDPWPKKRHRRRRLINQAFADAAARCLQADGRLIIATDWAPYAEAIDEVFATHTAFEPMPPETRPSTPFEHKGTTKGHKIYDFSYRCKAGAL